jgi:hypothetical protein
MICIFVPCLIRQVVWESQVAIRDTNLKLEHNEQTRLNYRFPRQLQWSFVQSTPYAKVPMENYRGHHRTGPSYNSTVDRFFLKRPNRSVTRALTDKSRLSQSLRTLVRQLGVPCIIMRTANHRCHHWLAFFLASSVIELPAEYAANLANRWYQLHSRG